MLSGHFSHEDDHHVPWTCCHGKVCRNLRAASRPERFERVEVKSRLTLFAQVAFSLLVCATSVWPLTLTSSSGGGGIGRAVIKQLLKEPPKRKGVVDPAKRSGGGGRRLRLLRHHGPEYFNAK